MARLLLLTDALGPSTEVLPALGLLPHHVKVAPAEPAAPLQFPDAEVLLVDARHEILGAKALCRALQVAALGLPTVAILTEGGLIAVNAEWGLDDLLLTTAGPAEVDARLRLLAHRAPTVAEPTQEEGRIVVGDVVIDEEAWSARVRGEPLDLTYKEFELLKYLARNSGRVLTRAQLLDEVWGQDYFGGVRTVDVHVRRLRAKLGTEHESLIGTVRNVGYRFLRTDHEAPTEDEA